MADTDASVDLSGIDRRAEAEAIAGEAKYWHQQLELSNRDHKDFLEEGKTVVQRYKGDRKTVARNQKRFNILYSNTETLKAALFARMAKPDVRRRFADRDPVAKQVAEIIERAAEYAQDIEDAEKAYEAALEDYLLPGRGIVRVCYEAETAKGEDDKEYVAGQDLYEEHVNWQDYRHEPAKTWAKVGWEAFRHLMSRDDLTKNFGDGMEAVPLNWTPDSSDQKIPDSFKRAEVWEVWDKAKKKRLWIVPGYDKVLRKDDDPYGLRDFFPNAEPLQAIKANDTFVPRPEFSVYQDQADGLDEIEARIDKLTRALRRRGVYDATFKELGRLAKAADNEFVPVKNYAELSQKGGLAAAFQAEDIKSLAEVLGQLHEQRDLRIQTIYEVTGIADIMRGSTDPRETLGAQKIKAQFGGNRLKKRQDQVQKWIRDTLRIKSEIIAEHFEPQKLAEMTGFRYIPAAQMQAMQMQAQAQQAQPPQPGQPAPPQPQPMPDMDELITDEMVQILRDDKLRSYRVDIETDSTVFEDAEAEKAGVVEMVSAASKFVEAWLPVIQAQPAMLDLAFEMLSFALRRFKMGRSLEDVIDQTKMKLQEAAQQPKPPDPKVQAEQAKAQAAQQKAQLDLQAAQEKAAIEMQKMQAQIQFMQQKMGLEAQAHQQEMAAKQQELAMDAQAREQQMAMDQQAQQSDMAMRERENAMSAEAAEHQHRLGMEATDHKHQTGLEMMAEKAKQAKQPKAKPNA
jgi:hypothetical protein